MEREVPEYIKRLRVLIETEQAQHRAHMDRQFFELKLHIYIAFELLRRRTARLEMRISRLEDATQTVDANQKEVRLPYWALN